MCKILTLNVQFRVELDIGALFLLLAVDVRGLVLQVGDAGLGDVAAVSDGHVQEGLLNGMTRL